jgi:hypothetical protein
MSNFQSRIFKTNRLSRGPCLLFMLLVLRQFWQVLKELFLKLGWVGGVLELQYIQGHTGGVHGGYWDTGRLI